MQEDNLVNLAKRMTGELSAMQVNIFDAKTDLSKLIKMLENQEEESITIARNGKPVAKLIPYEKEKESRKLGIAKNRLKDHSFSWEEWEAMDKEIEELFGETVDNI